MEEYRPKQEEIGVRKLRKIEDFQRGNIINEEFIDSHSEFIWLCRPTGQNLKKQTMHWIRFLRS